MATNYDPTAETQPTATPAPRVLSAKWDDRSTFTVPEAAKVLRIAEWSAWQAVKTGQLGVVRIGRRTIVPRAVLEKLLGA